MEEEDGEGQNKQILERDGAALHLCLTITRPLQIGLPCRVANMILFSPRMSFAVAIIHHLVAFRFMHLSSMTTLLRAPLEWR